MAEMLMHCGGVVVPRAELDLVKVPERTATYVPIPHHDLVNLVSTVSADVLRDYTLIGETFALARKGNQMFAILKFKGDSNEMAMSIAFRSSYDKSMSFGMAFGSSVFCCDNLSLCGDVVVMKRHSKSIMETLEDTVISNIFRAQRAYEKILIDSDRLKRRQLDDKKAFEVMGLLYGLDVISPRQLTTLRDEWLHPTFEDFQPRNAWSLMNATTHALKSTPPYLAMEKTTKAYNMIIDV